MKTKTISVNDAYYILSHTRALTRDRDQLAAMIANAAPICRNSRATDDEKLAGMINAVQPYYNKLDLTRAMGHDGGVMVWYAIRGQNIVVDNKIDDTIIRRPHFDELNKLSRLERFMNDIFLPIDHTSHNAISEKSTIDTFIDSGRDIAARVNAIANPTIRPKAA